MNDGDVLQALRLKAEGLRDQLLAQVAANLSGDVLATRTGTLKASIIAELTVDAGGLAVTLASRGVPYAAIQEYGGTTPAHDIVPVKARALRFAGSGGERFAANVHHPGSVIPARAYLGSALADMRDEIVGGLKDAMREALGIV